MSYKIDLMKLFKVANFAGRRIFHLFGLLWQVAVQEFLMTLGKNFKLLKAVQKKFQMSLFIKYKNLKIKIQKKLLLSLH